MTIVKKILDWATNLPGWQGDALRRIWIHGELGDQDVSDILAMLKADHGLVKTESPVPAPCPLTESHASAPNPEDPPVVLKAMYALKNVNALHPEQRIDFCPEGVTVIYGENAAGKSGYSRVLKRACRARGEKESIYPNVFHRNGTPSAAEAMFDVSIDRNQDSSLKWVDGEDSPSCLSQIAVFDSKCARVYVDEKNEVVYIPYGLDTLTKLAEFCDDLRGKIQDEMRVLEDSPKILQEIVGEGRIIPVLAFDTPTQVIEDLAKFTEDDEGKLKQLEKEVADLIANDPKDRARALTRRKLQIDQLRHELMQRRRALSFRNVKRLEELHSEMEAAEELASLASANAFQNEPLKGVGTHTWRLMFDAAKRYSETIAYPGNTFPVVDDESRCVLCQQLLDTEAKDRFQRFKNFVERDAIRIANEKRQSINSIMSEISELDYELDQRYLTLFEEIHERNPKISEMLRSSISSMQARARAIEVAQEDRKWTKIPELSEPPWGLLSGLSKNIGSEAAKLETISRQEEGNKKEEELRRSKEKQLLSQSKDIVLQHIVRLDTIRRLKECYDAAVTTGITRKKSELMQEAISQELKLALNEELARLGANHIKLEIETTGRIGSTFHKLTLSNCVLDKVNIAEVLSEGEHRIVAIASFMAELKTVPHRCGIVFDDPVSSLDHLWREKVATRLVTEAKNRQVIIFTHDIVLLLALQYEASIQGVRMGEQTVARHSTLVGICDSRLPRPAMTVNQRIAHLNEHLQIADKCFKNSDPSYPKEVEHFYGLLREAWERLIEEVLFGDVVQRFRENIETQKLRSVTISDEDFKTVYLAMKQCSRRLAGHDQAAAASSPHPHPSELVTDLKILIEFTKELRSRQKQVEKQRREMVGS